MPGVEKENAELVFNRKRDCLGGKKFGRWMMKVAQQF